MRRAHIGMILFLLQETGSFLLRSRAILSMSVFNACILGLTLLIVDVALLHSRVLVGRKLVATLIMVCGVAITWWVYSRLDLDRRAIQRYSKSKAGDMKFRCYILSYAFGIVLYIGLIGLIFTLR